MRAPVGLQRQFPGHRKKRVMELRAGRLDAGLFYTVPESAPLSFPRSSFRYSRYEYTTR
jgi:hypothetical protein